MSSWVLGCAPGAQNAHDLVGRIGPRFQNLVLTLSSRHWTHQSSILCITTALRLERRPGTGLETGSSTSHASRWPAPNPATPEPTPHLVPHDPQHRHHTIRPRRPTGSKGDSILCLLYPLMLNASRTPVSDIAKSYWSDPFTTCTNGCMAASEVERPVIFVHSTFHPQTLVLSTFQPTSVSAFLVSSLFLQYIPLLNQEAQIVEHSHRRALLLLVRSLSAGQNADSPHDSVCYNSSSNGTQLSYHLTDITSISLSFTQNWVWLQSSRLPTGFQEDINLMVMSNMRQVPISQNDVQPPWTAHVEHCY